MKKIEMRKDRADLRGLKDKMIRFCFAFLVHSNQTQAAIDAGYSEKTAHNMGCRLMKNPKIKAFIEKVHKQDRKKFEVDRYEVLEHLVACVTRDGKDFVDDQGRLMIDNLNDLPDRVTKAIDGIKQKRKVYSLPDGTEVEETETELKLVPKAVAIRMAMEHKGLFAAQEVTHKLAFDFDQLYFPPENSGETLDIQGEENGS